MQLNYKSFGQGEPIIILHGLFGTLDNWQTIAKQLAESHSVFIIDQRNHGRSPHTEEHTYQAMADDLHEFMTSHWMYGATVIGHSMGGKTAMQFALSYPDMVDKLVVVDIAPVAYEGGHQAIFEALFDLKVDTVESRSAADDFLKSRIPEYCTRQFLLKNLTREKTGGFKWKMNLEVLHEHYQDILGAIESDHAFENPTLFIRGGTSDYIKDEYWSEILDLFPFAQLETVENAGHWVHAAAPEELLTIVRKFLDE